MMMVIYDTLASPICCTLVIGKIGSMLSPLSSTILFDMLILCVFFFFLFRINHHMLSAALVVIVVVIMVNSELLSPPPPLRKLVVTSSYQSTVQSLSRSDKMILTSNLVISAESVHMFSAALKLQPRSCILLLEIV